MPTFSDPIAFILTAGTVNFTFINSKQVGKSYVQTWKDLDGEFLPAGELKTKYDESNPNVVRGVVQVTAMLPIADGSRKPCTFNVSGVFHREHSVTELTTALEAVLSALAVAGVKSKFLARI